MKCIIIYQSKTGFTKKYAIWIQEELHCDLKPIKKVSKKELSAYDLIIFGSYIRVEKVRGWKKVKDLVGEAGKNKLVVFATGSTPMTEESHIESVWKGSLSEKDLAMIPHFYMQSGLNYEKMGPADKLLMKGFAAIMKLKNRNKGDSQDLSKSYDNSSKEYIKPLVKYVKKSFFGRKRLET